MGTNISKQRLESLDVLRGFDLFCLVALEGIMHPLAHAIDASWFNTFMWNFTHVDWEGLSPWDLVMPLFLFMSGVSIPFALSHQRKEAKKGKVYQRILKRVALLWIFGMMCQGNLLGLNPERIYLYTNTLQSIAIGYLVASVLFLNIGIKTQIGIAAGLLLTYWGCMEFITINGFGNGNYTPDGNLAEWIDRTVLGRFRDAATLQDGQVVFATGYRYTWILSSLNFAVTTLTGLFAGHILKNKSERPIKKFYLLASIGMALVAAGWLWSFQMPVIKKIWTSTMVLQTSGWCFLLMAIFYWAIDCKGWRKHTEWLKVYGMNSIVAYMLASCISFSCIGRSLLHGLEQYVGDYYPVLIACSNAAIIYLILWILYRQKVFLKV
jgi:predicted acyltransferase